MSDDFLDFTLLKKKGILDRARDIEINENKIESNSKRIIDFSVLNKQENNFVSESSNSNSTGESALGFLSSFAEVPQLSIPVENISSENINSELNSRLDSLTRQIEGIFEKLSLIEGKLNNFEDKVLDKA